MALFFIKDIIYSIASLVSIFYYVLDNEEITKMAMIVAVASFVVYILVPLFLLFKTNEIVDVLKLDNGIITDNVFSETISKETILRIAIVVIGAILFIQEVPTLCKEIYYAILNIRNNFSSEKSGYLPLYISVAKCIIGLLIIGERKNILSLLLKKTESDKLEK